jgi:hypothetical protein
MRWRNLGCPRVAPKSSAGRRKAWCGGKPATNVAIAATIRITTPLVRCHVPYWQGTKSHLITFLLGLGGEMATGLSENCAGSLTESLTTRDRCGTRVQLTLIAVGGGPARERAGRRRKVSQTCETSSRLPRGLVKVDTYCVGR